MTAVALRAAHIGYPGAPPALRDVRLDVEEGRAIAILGGNGTGKTALLRALSGLMPGAGTFVEILGRRVASASDAVAAGAALVLQDPDDQLLGPTLLDDVLFGPANLGLPEREARARADAALEAMRIAHLAGRSIDALSFGERKRASIAGMLAMAPRVLLLDEPTAGLDPEGELSLCRTLRALSEERGTTLVLSTHAVDLVPLLATRVVLLGDGRVLADGPAREVFEQGELLARARVRRPFPAELWTRMRAAPSASAWVADRPAPSAPASVADRPAPSAPASVADRPAPSAPASVADRPAPSAPTPLPLTLEEALSCMTPVSC